MPEEVARKTCIGVDIEVFVPFEVAMTHATRDIHSVNYFRNMILVSELNAVIVKILRYKFFDAVTFRSLAGGIFDCGIWLCANSADYAIDCLGQTVNLAFYVTGKARL
jgi:hypothetical protein